MRRPLDRRRFLARSAGALSAAALSHLPLEAMALERAPESAGWDAGRLRHILPTVNDTEMLLKVSVDAPLRAAPLLSIGNSRVEGRMTDTAGEFWQFHATELDPGRPYMLSLQEASGAALCEPWPLTTFPAPDSQPERFRMLFYTCAGGPAGTYEGIGQRSGFLPMSIRRRLLHRALSFAPDAMVANGDHIYWDLHDWQGENAGQLSRNGRESGFDFSDRALGTTNETAMKAAAGQQIVPLYGNDFRSIPVFFIQDDHDHWENDAVTEDFASYPIQWFQLQLARATQNLYYPEFLRDVRRPLGLPWTATARGGDLSESFGTVRYGKLAEVLMYDVRRTVNLAGPNAVFIDKQVEQWLLDRTRSSDTRHLVHSPSNPFGWTAGKWGEWYPDIVNPDTGALTDTIEKPYWQEGWLRQHDRIARAITEQRERVALTIGGDLHALGAGKVYRSGEIDMSANPLNVILSGPIGTSVPGFPSVVRGIEANSPAHLDLEQSLPALEDHGFTLVDFLPDRIVVRIFGWDVDRQSVDAIDELEPIFTTELEPPA